jgi:hypothetical protein
MKAVNLTQLYKLCEDRDMPLVQLHEWKLVLGSRSGEDFEMPSSLPIPINLSGQKRFEKAEARRHSFLKRITERAPFQLTKG